jgi:hypothetical protein
MSALPPSAAVHRPLIETLDSLRETAEVEAAATLARLKKRMRSTEGVARLLRALTLTFIAAGVLAPFVGGAFPQIRSINFAGLGLLLIVLGGAMTAVDRFGGFSAAWTRYSQLIGAIEQDLNAFQVEWAVDRADAERGSLEDLSALAEGLKAFTSTLSSRFIVDTPPWIADLRATFPLDRPAPVRQEKPKRKVDVQPPPSAILPIRDDATSVAGETLSTTTSL